MTRIPLVNENATAELAALADRIRGARGGQLHVFYKALMHSPELAKAWFEFNDAVRFHTTLDDRTRELVIMRVAALTGCEYVWKVHEQRYAASAGLGRPEIDALRGQPKPDAFNAREHALLVYVEAMTEEVGVPDVAYDGISKHFAPRAIAEITVLVGAYNMQTRVLRALGIEEWKP